MGCNLLGLNVFSLNRERIEREARSQTTMVLAGAAELRMVGSVVVVVTIYRSPETGGRRDEKTGEQNRSVDPTIIKMN